MKKLNRRKLRDVVLKETKKILKEFRNINQLDVVHVAPVVRDFNKKVVAALAKYNTNQLPQDLSENGRQIAYQFETMIASTNSIMGPDRTTDDRIATCDRAINDIQEMKILLKQSSRVDYDDTVLTSRPYDN
tara:strand:+ start:12756 stop:13151 length:396 start_codon:yes stop_codon:yes gene_type:complete